MWTVWIKGSWKIEKFKLFSNANIKLWQLKLIIFEKSELISMFSINIEIITFREFAFLMFSFLMLNNYSYGQNIVAGENNELIEIIVNTPDFISLWKFNEQAGKARFATGLRNFPLQEKNGKIERIQEAPVSGF